MKYYAFLVLIWPFLVCALPPKLLPVIAAAAANIVAEPVKDSFTGKELRTDAHYFIIPSTYKGGALSTVFLRNKTCPLAVAQDLSPGVFGKSVLFKPAAANSKKGGDVIRTSTDLNIKFSDKTACTDQSTVWKLSYDNLVKKWIVTTGGVEGNPGRRTIYNWFKIEKDGIEYRIRFCPTVCPSCKIVCRYIGYYVQDQFRYLGLSDVPVNVRFRMRQAGES